MTEPAAWREIVARHQQPSTKRAVWQLATTVPPYFTLWFVMYHVAQASLWLVIPLALLAGAFLVRIFIIFHDCGHGSYFASRRANELVGVLCGVLTLSPYAHWRWEHAIHHGGAGDLDKRGTGDIWTMTVQEYRDASRLRRLHYRVVRNPLLLFVIAPVFVFIVKQRFASPRANWRQRRSVWGMNVALLCMALLLSSVFGFWTYALIQTTIILISGAAGVWLFYVQHQFDGVYWERSERWDYTAAALQGSSFYKLPKVLQWFSGNIGFHHIHHLGPRIPNYNLQRCHEREPLFQQVKSITLASSLQCLRFRFWDEQNKQLVGYAHLRQQVSEAPSRRSSHCA